jgi:two-component system chemotaxis response regulator CheB
MLDHDLAEMNAFGKLSAFTCPGCGGALWELSDGVLRYRCHTGHAFSAETLLAERSESIEATLYAAFRALREKATLSDRIADRLQPTSDTLAAPYRADAAEAERQAKLVRQLLIGGK